MSDVHPATPMGSPASPAPAMTPGQAAYEAAMLAIARQAAEGIDAARIAIMITWDEQTETVRSAWRDAAAAAIAAVEREPVPGELAAARADFADALRHVAAERDAAREEIDAHREVTKAVRAHMKVVTAERDQLQAAHNAVAAKNAELAAELDKVREDAREMRHLNAAQGARLGEIRNVVLQGGQNGDAIRRQLIAIMAAPIPLTSCPDCGQPVEAHPSWLDAD